MLITNANKVILHMPRCGGSSVRWAIMRAGYVYKFSCEHAPIKMIPKIYNDLPRIAFIRNPVDWYSSWYYHVKYYHQRYNRITSSIFAHVLSNGFNYSVDRFIYNAHNLKKFFSDNHNIKTLKDRIMAVQMNRYVCWHSFTWDNVDDIKYSDFNGSLFDYKYNLIGLNTAKVYRLEDGLQAVMDKEFDNVHIRVQNKTPNNILNSKPNQKSRELIYHTDKKYFDIFNYKI